MTTKKRGRPSSARNGLALVWNIVQDRPACSREEVKRAYQIFAFETDDNWAVSTNTKRNRVIAESDRKRQHLTRGRLIAVQKRFSEAADAVSSIRAEAKGDALCLWQLILTGWNELCASQNGTSNMAHQLKCFEALERVGADLDVLSAAAKAALGCAEKNIKEIRSIPGGEKLALELLIAQSAYVWMLQEKSWPKAGKTYLGPFGSFVKDIIMEIKEDARPKVQDGELASAVYRVIRGAPVPMKALHGVA